MPARVGVVLSGCGVFDGTEIHEAVSVLIALDQRGAEVVCLAPDVPQMHTIDHLTGQPVEPTTPFGAVPVGRGPYRALVALPHRRGEVCG